MWSWLPLLASAAEPSCPSGTQPAFRCSDGARWALLCAGPSADAPATLQYLYGRKDKAAELTFPATPSLAPFGLHETDDSWAVRFSNGGYTYRIWAETPMVGLPSGGVTAQKGDATVSELRCMPEVERGGLSGRIKVDPLAAKPAPPMPAAPSQCDKTQRTLLSCKIESKILSVCASPAQGDPTGLQYRFGPLGKPELVTPAAPSMAGLSFEVSQHAHASTRTIGFPAPSSAEGATVYRVWSLEVDSGCCGDVPAAGIAVVEQGKEIAKLECTTGLTGGFMAEALPFGATP